MKSGILILNKDKGITSASALNQIKRILNVKKIGHAGTLDPAAKGVLPVLINDATRISKLLLEKNKSYKLTGIIGINTDTYDLDGKILKEEIINSNNFIVSDFLKVLDEFKGEIIQYPPIYSAIKKDGKKLYEYARENKEVEITPRSVTIYDLKLVDYYFLDDKFYYDLIINVSKGFYVRSLVFDIAKKLNHLGTLKDLIRIKSGMFTIEESYSLEDIKNGNYKIIELEDFFKNTLKINVTDYMKNLILNGVYLDERQIKTNEVFRVYNKEKLIAVYEPIEIDKYIYQPLVVLRDEEYDNKK